MPAKGSSLLPSSTTSLDPSDWVETRAQGHRMLDDLLDHLENLRDQPVWQPTPSDVASHFQASLPMAGDDLENVYQDFKSTVMPYAIGNSHPGFMGWVHGGGSVAGLLAEMLAAGLNPNLGGRDQAPIAVERQVVRWTSQLFGFPADASGLFVTGSSIANFIGLLVARTAKLGTAVRAEGNRMIDAPLTAYASSASHGCIARAMEMAGLGERWLRRIDVDERHRMMTASLRKSIEADVAAGRKPFCIIATAGSVNTGAIDDLRSISEIAKEHRMWLHVDGACGALGMMSRKVAEKLQGIQQADSIALDFHKWAQVPYEAGFILVRNSKLHYDTFAAPAVYLSRDERAMSAGSPWPCDFGPDLSRSFKALKVWFTLRVYGVERLGAMMDRTCELAQYMAAKIRAHEQLELMADVELNIVCFRYRCDNADAINAEILVAVQRSGLAAPSSTVLGNRFAIRAAIFNHRTTPADIDTLLEAVIRFGDRLTSSPNGDRKAT